MIPETIWRRYPCLVVHPGPCGDRGPSSLDWAIELEAGDWGVTVLQANGEFDAGRVLATQGFRMRTVGKASLYRHEVRHAAIEALREALGRITEPSRPGERTARPVPTGCARPAMGQDVRALDWRTDSSETVMRKIRAAEGHPGVLDSVGGREFHLFGVHPERWLRGSPGDIIAQRHGAVCRATVDGAVWITQLRRPDAGTWHHAKLPATRALEQAGIQLTAPEVGIAVDAETPAADTYREIAYEEREGVGYLRFDFYNGAMSTDQCRRLRDAYAHARKQRQTRAIVLLGGDDYFANGIHLGMIEAAGDPAAESWRNLVAIDDLVADIIETDSHLVISALAGDAAAGGVPLALAADYAVARQDIVLHPYYRHMGGLYGSEYWTYLLPRRVGAAVTSQLNNAPFKPVGAPQAVRTRLLDAVFDAGLEDFRAATRHLAERVANDGLFRLRLEYKRRRRAADERSKPLRAYRAEELDHCRECLFGGDPAYHVARRRFVYKLAGSDPGPRRHAEDGRPRMHGLSAAA
jgi:putative two-component system hydrogenase maturation factor HypX/HoxX